MSKVEQADNTLLAEFPRKNRDTGAAEILRVSASDYQGYLYFNARIFYHGRSNGPDDDGLRPDKFRGVTFREYELDQVIAALEEARTMVHEQGRSTAPETRSPARAYRPARRNDRPAPVSVGAPQEPSADDDGAPF